MTHPDFKPTLDEAVKMALVEAGEIHPSQMLAFRCRIAKEEYEKQSAEVKKQIEEEVEKDLLSKKSIYEKILAGEEFSEDDADELVADMHDVYVHLFLTFTTNF